MGGYKNQLSGNMKENYQFLTFLRLNSLLTSENLPLLTFWISVNMNGNWQL